MRILRIALGAAVGLGATFAAAELWKRIVHLEMSQGVQLSYGVNELVSFLPVAIVNGYLLWHPAGGYSCFGQSLWRSLSDRLLSWHSSLGDELSGYRPARVKVPHLILHVPNTVFFT